MTFGTPMPGGKGIRRRQGFLLREAATADALADKEVRRRTGVRRLEHDRGPSTSSG
jgi:hypothetical protein